MIYLTQMLGRWWTWQHAAYQLLKSLVRNRVGVMSWYYIIGSWHFLYIILAGIQGVASGGYFIKCFPSFNKMHRNTSSYCSSAILFNLSLHFTVTIFYVFMYGCSSLKPCLNYWCSKKRWNQSLQSSSADLLSVLCIRQKKFIRHPSLVPLLTIFFLSLWTVSAIKAHIPFFPFMHNSLHITLKLI